MGYDGISTTALRSKNDPRSEWATRYTSFLCAVLLISIQSKYNEWMQNHIIEPREMKPRYQRNGYKSGKQWLEKPVDI